MRSQKFTPKRREIWFPNSEINKNALQSNQVKRTPQDLNKMN